MTSIVKKGRRMNFQVRKLCTTVMFFLLATSAAEGHTTTTVHDHEMSMMAWDWPGMGRGSLVPIGVILLLVLVILAFRRWVLRRPKFHRLSNFEATVADPDGDENRIADHVTGERSVHESARKPVGDLP